MAKLPVLSGIEAVKAFNKKFVANKRTVKSDHHGKSWF